MTVLLCRLYDMIWYAENPKDTKNHTHTHTHTHVNNQSNLEKEQIWKHHGLWFQLYYKVIITKTVWHWHKNRYIDQWNRIEIPEVNPQICKINQYVKYGKLIYNKGARNVLWGNDSHFNKRCWKNQNSHMQRNDLNNCLIPYTKINTKWIKVLNVSLEALNLPEKNRCYAH